MADVNITIDGVIAVDGKMTVANASSLKEALLEALNHSPGAVLDLSDVQEMDSAGFQLLVLLKREAAHGGRAFRVKAHSNATLEIVRLFSAEDEMGQS